MDASAPDADADDVRGPGDRGRDCSSAAGGPSPRGPWSHMRSRKTSNRDAVPCAARTGERLVPPWNGHGAGSASAARSSSPTAGSTPTETWSWLVGWPTIRTDRLSQDQMGRPRHVAASTRRPSGTPGCSTGGRGRSTRGRADRQSDMKDALVAAIDDWALCAGRRQPTAAAKPGCWRWRGGPIRTTVGWRDRLRDPSVRRDKQELSRLADSASLSETPVNLLVSLGELLRRIAAATRITFLHSVQRHHPDDLGVNYLLGPTP